MLKRESERESHLEAADNTLAVPRRDATVPRAAAARAPTPKYYAAPVLPGKRVTKNISTDPESETEGLGSLARSSSRTHSGTSRRRRLLHLHHLIFLTGWAVLLTGAANAPTATATAADRPRSGGRSCWSVPRVVRGRAKAQCAQHSRVNEQRGGDRYRAYRAVPCSTRGGYCTC